MTKVFIGLFGLVIVGIVLPLATADIFPASGIAECTIGEVTEVGTPISEDGQLEALVANAPVHCNYPLREVSFATDESGTLHLGDKFMCEVRTRKLRSWFRWMFWLDQTTYFGENCAMN